MSVKVKEKAVGWNKMIGEMAGIQLTVGVQRDEASAKHPDSELTVGQLAAIHELGLGVPQRSWLRSWFDSRQGFIVETLKKAETVVLNGVISRKKAMDWAASVLVEDIQRRIYEGEITPPLAPSTVAAKGHAIPLLDSETLVKAITGHLKVLNVANIKDLQVREAVRRAKL